MKNKVLDKVIMAMAVLLVVSICMNAYVVSENGKLSEENSWYDYQYKHAYNACESVAEYCNSTMDTGQMDEFLESDNGQFFWHEFDKVNENQNN